MQSQKSGPIKESLLKQVMGNQRNPLMQSEYTGQFNLSSSLYFQVMEEALRGTLENGESVLKQSLMQKLDNSLKIDDEFGEKPFKMTDIYRGLDEIPGKSFSQSQHHFRHSKIKSDNKS